MTVSSAAGTPSRHEGRAPSALLVLLGACAGWLFAVLPGAVLQPAVDRAPADLIGLTVTGVLLSAGWAWTTRRQHEVAGGALLGLGGALLLGALATLAMADSLRATLSAQLIGHGWLPYPLLIATLVAVRGAPLALPLGALIGLVHGSGGRRPTAALLAGTALGLATAPTLAGQTLGADPTLALTAVLAAVVSLSASLRAPWFSTPPRLPITTVPAIMVVGTAAALAFHLARPWIDLGTHGAAWFAALICLSAACGVLLPRSLGASVLDPVVALGAIWALASSPLVRSTPDADTALSVARLALVAVPLGVTLGLTLARPGRDTRVAALPCLALLPAPFVVWQLLPLLGLPVLLGLAAAVLLGAASLAQARPGLGRLFVLTALTAAAVILPVPGQRQGQPPGPEWQLADGLAALVDDPADGRTHMAVDGLAPLGRHPLQEHRLVHLPFLFQGGRGRALVIATDQGEAEAAALEHEPRELTWLRPFPVPGVAHEASPSETTIVHRQLGNERLALAAADDRGFDVIVMLPDPRVRRRAALVATREFYTQVREKLTPSGLFCQWWDPALISRAELRSALASARSIFPGASLLIDHPRSRRALLGLLAAPRPLTLRPLEIQARLDASPGLTREFELVGLDGLLAACLLGPTSGMTAVLAPPGDATQDARPALGDRAGPQPLPQDMPALALYSEHRAHPAAWLALPDDLMKPLGRRVDDARLAFGALMDGAQAVRRTHGDAAPAFEREYTGGFPEVEDSDILRALEYLPDWPYLAEQVLARAAFLRSMGHDDRAERWLRRALERDIRSTALQFTLAQLLSQRGQTAEAEQLYRQVLALQPSHGAAREELESLATAR